MTLSKTIETAWEIDTIFLVLDLVVGGSQGTRVLHDKNQPDFVRRLETWSLSRPTRPENQIPNDPKMIPSGNDSQFAIENGPVEIVNFPIKHGASPNQ